MTADRQDAYDDALSAIRNHVDDLGAWLGIWENRKEPDAHARRCAGDAVNAMDSMLRQLYLLRGTAQLGDPPGGRRSRGAGRRAATQGR